MMVKNVIKAALIGSVALGMVGCASKHKHDASMNPSYQGNQVSSLDEMRSFYGQDMTPAEEQALLAKKTFYFGFDRFDVSEENRLALMAHARKLMNDPQARIRIDGHTDERGSREYNIGLGERRAKSARDVLRLKGVRDEQIAIVSYGKEKPVAFGHDEDAWSLNRRAVVTYEDESGDRG